jgi:F0F1-type ATP synthase epsilon subunit
MVLRTYILSSSKMICSNKAEQVIVPGADGLIGLTTNHARLMASLETGLINLKIGDTWSPVIIIAPAAVEIYRNMILIGATEIEELPNKGGLEDEQKELQKAINTLKEAVEDKQDTDMRIRAVEDLRLARARVQAAIQLADSPSFEVLEGLEESA